MLCDIYAFETRELLVTVERCVLWSWHDSRTLTWTAMVVVRSCVCGSFSLKFSFKTRARARERERVTMHCGIVNLS